MAMKMLDRDGNFITCLLCKNPTEEVEEISGYYICPQCKRYLARKVNTMRDDLAKLYSVDVDIMRDLLDGVWV